jgi:hypothetical protein
VKDLSDPGSDSLPFLLMLVNVIIVWPSYCWGQIMRRPMVMALCSFFYFFIIYAFYAVWNGVGFGHIRYLVYVAFFVQTWFTGAGLVSFYIHKSNE